MKELFIAEKPSVAEQFADALGMGASNGKRNGYLETERYIVTWCLGHLVTMSYPEAYDARLKSWRFDTLPFLPREFKYEVIAESKRQFQVVAGLLKRRDVSRIYICTDSGREGEYIYRLVDQMAGVGEKEKRRVWIDSQTQEEIRRGIREARPSSDYDMLAASAFCRAREDYLMGINFSRALTLRYGREISARLGRDRTVVSAGRVMTCVLGMVVRREEEIRSFQKTTYYKVWGDFCPASGQEADKSAMLLHAEFCPSDTSPRYAPTDLYKNSGFLKREKAEAFVKSLTPYIVSSLPGEGEGNAEEAAKVGSVERKRERKPAPLLYNLAELQNDCARLFKISPEKTLSITQELYEKKLCTYPRTDARVLSSAIAKEIGKNLKGLKSFPPFAPFAGEILQGDSYQKIGRTRYTDDRKITDHYAIIPTGQGRAAYPRLSPLSRQVYDRIARRFLAIFYPPAVYQRLTVSILLDGELFIYRAKLLLEEGYLKLYQGEGKEEASVGKAAKKKEADVPRAEEAVREDFVQKNPVREGEGTAREGTPDSDEGGPDQEQAALLKGLRKGQRLFLKALSIKEGETSPPKRYTSGSIILAMENAGKLIEDEELRAQIRGCGIGTSATRASILGKLVKIDYISLDEKTQTLSPTRLGEMVTRVVRASVKQLLDPELTASWEKGLSYVADGSITEQEYMEKLRHFVITRTNAIKRGRIV